MKALAQRRAAIRVADEAWIVLALLHREHPDRADFTEKEILERASLENLTGSLRAGLQIHLSYHCVANKPPNPSTYRMLLATGEGTRRLYRDGNPYHPKRTGKTVPDFAAIPSRYHYLLDWYGKEYSPQKEGAWLRGIFEMEGAGKDIWAGVDADDYVRQLREGWD